MRASLHGRLSGPAVAVVGVWDPLVPAHRDLFEQVSCHAERAGLSSLAVLIDPDPALVMRGRADWPVYDDARARGARLRAAGIDAVLRLRFEHGDLAYGAAEFFDLIGVLATLRELWIGAHQSLGRGPLGSRDTIARLAQERGISLCPLPPVRLLPSGYDVRQALASGQIARAATMVGRHPVRSRPSRGKLRLAWQPGIYRVLPLSSPIAPPRGTPIEVELVADGNGVPGLAWPNPDAPYIAFVEGPGDDEHTK